MLKFINFVKSKKFDFGIYILFFIFSIFLMFHTFTVIDGGMAIASKLWSDFAATIPLIRSFSQGYNFPPQYPLFSGPPIRYHFLFYFFVGMLEKTGLRIDFSLNLLSSLGFFLLLSAIYKLALVVFKSKKVAFVSVILFLFNGSLSFLEFFKKYPLSLDTIKNIVSNSQFPSFGPYDGKIVSAFWNLNIFTNQRHLSLAYAFFILILIIFYKSYINSKSLNKQKILILSILIGLFPFFHLAVFAMIEVLLVISIAVFPKIRRQIIFIFGFSLLLSIPQILYMGESNVKTKLFNPGYLIDNLNVFTFLKYWLFNLGAGIFTSLVGFILANKNQRKIFLPFLSLFVVGNLFRFSPEIAANHKFFNLYIIGANIFSSYALVMIFQKKIIGKVVSLTVFFFLTLSGLIDFFPVINDPYIRIPDFPVNETSLFIKKNTLKNSVFLNAKFLYDPASIAGRKIYLGWPYFSWSAGYDTDKRFITMKQILKMQDKNILCRTLENEKIDFIEIQTPTTLENIEIDYDFFNTNFMKIFESKSERIKIFDVNKSCKNYLN